MSQSQFRDKFLPLNTEDDVIYGWYLTKNYDWRVFKLERRNDGTGWIYSNRPGLKLKAVTHGRNDILFYDNNVGLGRDIYGNLLDIVVDAGYVKQLDIGGFIWDGEDTRERQLDAEGWTDKIVPSIDSYIPATDNDGDIDVEETVKRRFKSGLVVTYNTPDEYFGPTNKYEEHLYTMLDIHELYYTKNQDYGDAFTQSLDKHGPIAALVRMEDKWNRLSNLMSSGKEGYIKSESVEDTLIDLANYAIMTALYLRGNHKDD